MKKSLNPHAGSFVPTQRTSEGNSPIQTTQYSDHPVISLHSTPNIRPCEASVPLPALPSRANAPPSGQEMKSSIHRLLLHARRGLAQRFLESPYSSHLPFERLLFHSFRQGQQTGQLSISGPCRSSAVASSSPPPFWLFFTPEQFAEVAAIIADVEVSESSSSDRRGSNGPSSLFSEDEKEILKGIYFRNVYPSLPLPSRRVLTTAILEQAGEPVTDDEISKAAVFLLDIYWFVYRTAFLPIVDDCGLHALSACIQHLTQLRQHLIQPEVAAPFIRLALPMMVLSRYYAVLVKNSFTPAGATDSDAAARLAFAYHVPAIVTTYIACSPDDSLEAVLERYSSELLRDLLPTFFATTSDVLSVFTVLAAEHPLPNLLNFRFHVDETCATMVEAAASTMIRAAVTVPTTAALEAQVFTNDDDDDERSRSSSSSNFVRFAAPTTSDSLFHEQVLEALSWCNDDNVVRFATLLLANTDSIPLSKLAQLMAGLREAYSTTTGSFETLFETISAPPSSRKLERDGDNDNNNMEDGAGGEGVPPAIREVVELLMVVIRPGHPPHVDAFDDAMRLVESRLDEQLQGARQMNGSLLSIPKAETSVPRQRSTSAGEYGIVGHSSTRSTPSPQWAGPPAMGRGEHTSTFTLWQQSESATNTSREDEMMMHSIGTDDKVPAAAAGFKSIW